MATARMLIADDDQACRTLLAALARAALGGASITLARDGGEAIEALTRDPPDVIVTDFQMPRANGIEVTRAARRARPGVVIVVLSGALTPEQERDAMAAGASICMRKPFDIDQLTGVLRAAAAESMAATIEVPPPSPALPM